VTRARDLRSRGGLEPDRGRLESLVVGSPSSRTEARGQCRRLLGWGYECAELLEHRKVVADRPPLGHPAVDESVGERGVAGVGAGGDVEPAEGPAGPLVFPCSELHHEVALGDEMRLDPSRGELVAPGVREELAGPFDARGASGSEGVVLHVGRAQLVEPAEIADPVAEVVEFAHDGLVVFDVHTKSVPDSPRPAGEAPAVGTRGHGGEAVGRRCRGDAGSVTPLWIVFTFALMLMAAVLFEGGRILAARRDATNLALQGARAGAQVLDEAAVRSGPVRLDPAGAEMEVRAFLGGRVDSVVVRVVGDQVTVTVTMTQQTPALAVIGIPSRTVSATESARAVRG
jgi:hypothetical protein